MLLSKEREREGGKQSVKIKARRVYSEKERTRDRMIKQFERQTQRKRERGEEGVSLEAERGGGHSRGI